MSFQRMNRPHLQLLVTISVAYLFLPNCLFFAMYLRWDVAILFFFILLLGGKRFFFMPGQSLRFPPIHDVRKKPFLFMLIVLCFLMLLSGIGGYGSQDGDWQKHNAMLSALIRHQWPVAYSLTLPSAQSSLQQPLSVANVPLVYYIAYYLPAAVIGKLFGWFWANQALFLWTFFGGCLAIGWFQALSQQAGYLPAVIFCVFSGLDAIGISVIRFVFLGESPGMAHWIHIERWAGNWEYPSHITSIFWAPHQGICAWIITGLLVNELVYAESKRRVLFFLSLTALWSPFVMLGAMPYIIGELFWDTDSMRKKMADYVSMPNLCGVLLLAICGIFYLSKSYPSPLPFVPVEQGLIFSSPVVPGLSVGETLFLLVLFCMLEYGIYALLIHQSHLPFNARERRLFLISVGVLTLLPFFRYGFWNDLAMRASLPALFLLAVFLTRALYYSATRKSIRLLIVVSLLIGAINVAVEIKRHLADISASGQWYRLPSPGALYDIRQAGVSTSFFTQYIGSAESPFFQFLAKPLVPSEEILPRETK
ncbi:hypothetical protein U14_03206 [Candidatus Moduliflexus flocculans]|uniref:Uncharacterized protein n=1 Tax=Candidatus Moduliflexus flocculans TaxID=1499966 RepID=A0A081BNJ4_9BACT|nr:hypothetical protein U14_03206 [Candidatus Moduliflexus flocculans]